jgi:Domain of unknown function (DUF5666)
MNEEQNQDPTLIPPSGPIPESATGAAPDPSPPDGLWSDGHDDGSDPADRDSGADGKKSARSWIIAGAAAVVLVLASVVGINVVSGHTASSAASATTASGGPNGGPSGGFGGGATSGTITALAGSTITLSSTSGTTTKVTTSSSTTVSSSATAALGDVAGGDQVSVMGAVSGTDVTAERIVDTGTTADAGPGQGAPSGQAPPSGQTGSNNSGQAPPSGSGGPGAGGPGAGGPGGGVRGQVTSVDGSTLVVTGRDGTTYTVTASSTTIVTKVTASSLTGLAVGEQVQVMGATGTDGTVTADRIIEGAASFGGGGGTPGAAWMSRS